MRMTSVFVLVMFLAACSSSGGPPVTAQECEAALRKGWEFQDVTPAESLGDESADTMFASVARDCAKNQELSRKDYECLVRATSMREYDGCHAALHVH